MRVDHITERLPRDVDGRQLPPLCFLRLSLKVTWVRCPVSGDVVEPLIYLKTFALRSGDWGP